MRIRNWAKFQHYKGKAVRNAPWIKLYTKLINDRQWHALNGDASKLLVSLWLLANEFDSDNGTLPPVADIAFRTRLPEKTVTSLISQLDHWVESDDSMMLAKRYQNADLEGEGEGEEKENEREKEKEIAAYQPPPSRAKSSVCLETYFPQEATVNALRSEGFSDDEIRDSINQMIDWSRGGAKRKTDWDATLRNWCRRNKKSPARALTKTEEAIKGLFR